MTRTIWVHVNCPRYDLCPKISDFPHGSAMALAGATGLQSFAASTGIHQTRIQFAEAAEAHLSFCEGSTLTFFA